MGKPGLDQRVELLVEDQEIVGADGAVARRLVNCATDVEIGADGENVEAALGKLLPGLALRLGRLHLLEDAAGRCPRLCKQIQPF